MGNLIEFPDTLQLIEAGIASNLLSHSIDQLDDLSDADTEGEDDIGEIFEIPIISHDTAIQHLDELSCYLQALWVSEVSTPTAKKIPVFQALQKALNLRSVLIL